MSMHSPESVTPDTRKQNHRRDFLWTSAAAGGLLLTGPQNAAAGNQLDQTADQLIKGKDKRLLVLKPDPAVLETPLSLLYSNRITPTSLLFVRNNQQPKAMATTDAVRNDKWKINICGKSISLARLKQLNQKSLEMVLQCSGNGRSLFSLAAQTAGTQWGRGGMGCVVFGGVMLRDVLDDLKIEPGKADQFLLANGADQPAADKEDFLHTLPLDECINRSLLAIDLNESPLAAIHGGPVRLVTPGVFGTMHIKWLSQLDFVGEESSNYNHVPRYRVPKRRIQPGQKFDFSLSNSTYNWNMKVKTVLLNPADNSRLPVGRNKIQGVAFNDGSAPIETVLVSTDQGNSWTRAKLEPPKSLYSWTRFEADIPLTRNVRQIWTRAIDQLGRSQPLDGSVAWNPRGYEWNGVEKVSVKVD